jgi:hypothetical protein
MWQLNNNVRLVGRTRPASDATVVLSVGSQTPDFGFPAFLRSEQILSEWIFQAGRLTRGEVSGSCAQKAQARENLSMRKIRSGKTGCGLARYRIVGRLALSLYGIRFLLSRNVAKAHRVLCSPQIVFPLFESIDRHAFFRKSVSPPATDRKLDALLER